MTDISQAPDERDAIVRCCSDCKCFVERSHYGNEWCDALGVQMPGCTDGAESCPAFIDRDHLSEQGEG